MGALHWLTDLIVNYGYVIVLLGTVLEGETIVMLAGFLAYQGDLRLPIVVLVAIVGSVLGDQSFFYFGRLKGKQFLAKRPRLVARAAKIHALVERHQNWLMFLSRFMYGFRMLLPVTFGTSNVRRGKYLLLDLLGAIVWAIFFSFCGYAFGGVLETLVGRVHRAERFIVFGILIGIVLVQAIRFIERQVEFAVEKEEEKEEEVEKNGN